MSLILLGLALLIILLLIATYPFFWQRTSSDATIRIPRNATTAMLADSLEKYCGSKLSKSAMMLYKLHPANLQSRHGAYLIPAGSNAIGIYRKITRGGQTPVKITINGFRNIDLLCQRLASKLDFPADSLKTALSNPEVLKPFGLTPDQALGLFIDDTYEIYWDISPKELITKIGKNYLSFWTEENKNKAENLGITPAGMMTLASIVDEETNNVDEKGVVGRLYANRLKKNMRLQSDPTVRFALNDFTIRRVKAEHLKTNSPYNTYLHAGLPPGPIRTTSKTTLNAILNSAPNDYLYMCAKEDFSGTHNFATTFAEHSRNAARYRNALTEKGIF